MRQRDHEKSEVGHGGDGTLARLLLAEERLAAVLEGARAQASTILQAARDDAERIAAECDATIEARAAALVAAHESRLTRDLDEIHRSSAETVARYRAIDDATERQLAAFVIAQLLPARRESPS